MTDEPGHVIDGEDMAERLQGWMSKNAPGASGPIRAERLTGGSSNLTYRLRDDANDWVLRRPPVAHVLATAHDMSREFRVQQALAHTAVPVPQMIAECGDTSVIGAPFYLMERVDGVVYTDVDAVAHLTPTQSLRASYELMDVLAVLHSVDPESVDLADLGRPDGFLERQVRRWYRQWEQSRRQPVPALDEVAARLQAAMPVRSPTGLVHGDYSFNNAMFGRDDPTRIRALLDWEMATQGDPLTDVAMLLTYWGPVGELLWRRRSQQPQHANDGFPSASQLVDRYAASGGRDPSHLDFYLVLACFKLAIITAGVYARQLQTDPSAADAKRHLVEELAWAALETADKSTVPALRGSGTGTARSKK